jgi:hypothetical protein
MAAVEVTITGTLYDKLRRTTQQVVLIGEATLTGVGIGGGPIGGGGGGGGGGEGIWGPADPRPTNPIALPSDPPLGTWGPNDPRPSQPIYLPPDITPPEPPASGTKPPPADGAGWGYYDGRWGYFPGPSDAGPK